jgi:hypothetical protein
MSRRDPFADCDGCFLRERTGGVCPMARGSSPETQRQAERLHALMLLNAGTVPSFSELVRADAVRQTGVLPATTQAALPARSVVLLPDGSRKEMPNVQAIPVAARRRLR